MTKSSRATSAIPKMLATLGIVFPLVVVAAWLRRAGSPSRPRPIGPMMLPRPTSVWASDTGDDPALVVEEGHCDVHPSGLWEVNGVVANRSDRFLDYAEVVINFFDEDCLQVGSTTSIMNALEPGARWKFSALAPTKGATTYEIVRVAGSGHE